MFWGQSATLMLAAHLPEPSLAPRVLSPRVTIPNAKSETRLGFRLLKREFDSYSE